MLVDRGGGGAVQTASRVEGSPHKLYSILNIICHQTRQRPNSSNRLKMLFYRQPPPLELEYTISGEISYCNTLHFRFCIINLRFYCKLYFIPVGLDPYIVNFTSWNVCQDRLLTKYNINMWKTNISLQHLKLLLSTKLFFRQKRFLQIMF